MVTTSQEEGIRRPGALEVTATAFLGTVSRQQTSQKGRSPSPSWHQKNSLGELIPKKLHLLLQVIQMAPYFSLHPSFPTTRDDFSPLTLWDAPRVSICVRYLSAEREHSCSEQNSEGHPFRGVLQSDPALKGPGTRTTSLNEKVATDAALPSQQKRPSGD